MSHGEMFLLACGVSIAVFVAGFAIEFQNWRERQADHGPGAPNSQTFSTAFGDFLKTPRTHYWNGTLTTENYSIAVTIRDVRGAPDAGFVGRLPRIAADLPGLERMAREAEPQLAEGYVLKAISDSRGDTRYDLALLFRPRADEFRDTRYVEYKDGVVVRSWVGD